MTSPAGSQRYLIGYARTRGGIESQSPAPLAETLQEDPDIAVVETQGRDGQQSLFVVEMTPDRAERLQREFGGGLIVEKDAPLELS